MRNPVKTPDVQPEHNFYTFQATKDGNIRVLLFCGSKEAPNGTIKDIFECSEERIVSILEEKVHRHPVYCPKSGKFITYRGKNTLQSTIKTCLQEA